MAWKGSPENKVPNVAQESQIVKSEARVEVNRALETRRDTDKQKDFTVKLIDIDTAIIRQLEKFQLTIKDGPDSVKVPIIYATPDKWKSAQKDGYFRDYQGKILLPVIAFHRTTSDKDQNLMMFNRYLHYSVMKKYSEKNKYTPFAALVGQNVPINDVYEVVMPDHMIFTYHFIVWTETIEQNNSLVERLNFEAEDYWGDKRGLRFRTKVDSISHITETQVDQDRMVKSEFDLVVHGYLLPDVIDTFGGKKDTTQKHFTAKKIVMQESVSNTIETDPKVLNSDKWKSQKYPNLDSNDEAKGAPVVFPELPAAVQAMTKVLQMFKVITLTDYHLPPPLNSTDPGQEGWISYDSDYYYTYTNGQWKRVPLSLFNAFNTF